MNKPSFPWEQKSNVDSYKSSQLNFNANGSTQYKPYNSYGASQSMYNPFNTNSTFPWERLENKNQSEKSRSLFPWEQGRSAPTETSDTFCFTKDHKTADAGISSNPPSKSTFSSMFKEMNKLQASKIDDGEGSQISNKNRSSDVKAGRGTKLFPWEKDNQRDESVDNIISKHFARFDRLENAKTSDDYDGKKPNKKAEKAEVIQKQNNDITNKQAAEVVSSPKRNDEETQRVEENSVDAKGENTLGSENKEIVPTVPQVVVRTENQSPKNDASHNAPTTSPGKLSRSSSQTKVSHKKEERVKSAPPVPKHINKKSELLAKNYMSAYAKPKIPIKKPPPETEEPTKRKFYHLYNELNPLYGPSN